MVQGEVEVPGLSHVEIMPLGREYGVVEEEMEEEVQEEGEALGLKGGVVVCILVKLRGLLRKASRSGWIRNARLIKDSSEMRVLLISVGN